MDLCSLHFKHRKVFTLPPLPNAQATNVVIQVVILDDLIPKDDRSAPPVYL